MARKETKGMLNLTRKQGVILFITLVIGGGASLFAIKEINQPKTFEECLLKNIEGDETGEAVQAIQYACMQLTLAANEPEQTCRYLKPSEVERLQFELYSRKNEYDQKENFELRLYNGNDDITVESVVMEIKNKGFEKPRQYEMSSFGKKAAPKSAGIYMAEIDSILEGEVGKKLISARTCEKS